MNVSRIFHECSPSKFVVYASLLVFVLLFSLRVDEIVLWSYWLVFLPLWLWKTITLAGAFVGIVTWLRHPESRHDRMSFVQYRAMMITASLHLLLAMFEVLACIRLDGYTPIYWTLAFTPLFFASVLSIGLCVWAVKNERSFELELFCAVNVLLFIFIAIRLDGFIQWSWVVVFVPLWVAMTVALVFMLYALVLAIVVMRSRTVLPEQRQINVNLAIGYIFIVIPLIVFEVLIAEKLDGVTHYYYSVICIPLYLALITLTLMTCCSKGGNMWWFGIRKDFCEGLLDTCPLLQEYGNIKYNLQFSNLSSHLSSEGLSMEEQKPRLRDMEPAVEVLHIDAPD